eukprot:TRINITY_DN9254_c0_g1_i1.p1 TRINITY_DN9254_c0_g1~~TRINITY_DN9254_c0_g1_i1.p1  ORF type:complete len:283 (+),score=43.34 TRINITY_DN9254_c0_g1_i1:79-927(+)
MTECMMTGPVHGAWHERIIKERNRAGMRDDLASAAVHLTWTAGFVSSAEDHERAMASAGWTWFPSGMKLPLPAYRRSRTASCPSLKEAELPQRSAERCSSYGSVPVPCVGSGDLPKPPTAPAPSMRLPSMEGLETACEVRHSSGKASGAGFCFQGQDATNLRRRPLSLGHLKSGWKAGGDVGSTSTSASSGSRRDPSLFKEGEFGTMLRWRPSSSLLRRKGSGVGRKVGPSPEAKCSHHRIHTVGLDVASSSPSPVVQGGKPAVLRPSFCAASSSSTDKRNV